MTTIIIPRIPAITTLGDIREFIKPALKRVWPLKDREVDKYKIIIYKDTGTGEIEYHALIFVKEALLAKKIIWKLNGKWLLNKPVSIREYHIRSFRNDKRKPVALNSPEATGGLRKSDRRRGSRLQEINPAAISFIDVDMARKFG